MNSSSAPDREFDGNRLLPHQVAFIKQFFANASARNHLLESDAGLGTSLTVAHLIKRTIEIQRDARVLLLVVQKSVQSKMSHVLADIGVRAEAVDRFRYRELQDAIPAGDTVWRAGVAFLLSADFAQQAGHIFSVASEKRQFASLWLPRPIRGLC
jgi:hypothetical protein